MQLSDSLLKGFAEVANEETEQKAKEHMLYAHVVENNDTLYIVLDGSTILTPISSTAVEIRNGDRVTVVIKDHAAIVTGNISTPAITRMGATYTRLTEEGVIVGLSNEYDEPEDAYTPIAPDGVYVKSDSTHTLAYFGTAIRLYKPGTSSVAVEITGSKATFEGEIKALSGTFGSGTYKINIGTNGNHSSIYYGKSTFGDTSSNGFYIGTDGIALGKGTFTVSAAGEMHARSGTIGSNATAGNRWQIGDKSIWNGADSISSTTAGTYIGTDGILNYANASKYVKIQSGKITAKDVDLSGKIEALSGTFGSGTYKINKGTNGNHSSIYYRLSTLGNTTNNGFYIGTDGIALGKGKFKVTADGTLTASGTITGSTITGSSLTTGINEVTASASIQEMDGVWSNSPFSEQYHVVTDDWYGTGGSGRSFITATKVEDSYTITRTGLSGSLIATKANGTTTTVTPRLFGWAHGFATKLSLIVGGRLYAGETRLKKLLIPLNKVTVWPSDTDSDNAQTTLSSLLAHHSVTITYSSAYITGGIYAFRIGRLLVIRFNSTLQADFYRDPDSNFTEIASLSNGAEYPGHSFAISDTVYTSCNPTGSDARLTLRVGTDGKVTMYNHSSSTAAKGMVRCELVTYCTI